MKVYLLIGFMVSASGAWAQQYLISTIAGGAPPVVYGGSVALGYPTGIVTDALGNLYFTSLNCAFKFGGNGGILTRVAGNSRRGYSGDGGPGSSAQMNTPVGIAMDGNGNFYIADDLNNRIRKVSAGGIVTTIAGSGTAGYSGDGGPATNAELNAPEGVAVDDAGNLYIADRGNARVRKVSPFGIITTAAGTGTEGYSGDGGPSANAQLGQTYGVALDGSGNLYISDTYNQVIRKISQGGTISTIAGNGTSGFSGDGGLATSAQLSYPFGLATDGSGNLFIADFYNNRIRKVSASGIITTVAGSGTAGFSGEGGQAASAELYNPSDMAVDGAGDLFIADQGNSRIREVYAANGIINTLLGDGSASYSNDGPATVAQLNGPFGVAVDSAGSLYIADEQNDIIRKVSGGIITTVAGNLVAGSSGDELDAPTGVTVDSAGNLYITDWGNSRVRKVSSTGGITTVAGNGVAGYSGDGGPAVAAQLNLPIASAVDGAGNLYIADQANHRIRKVSPTGTITTIAGNGVAGYSGDGGPAISAQFNFPFRVVADNAGSLYIADKDNSRIRMVSASGIITTVAGNGVAGYSGDGGLATSAQLNYPSDVAIDGAGNLYIADSFNYRLRMVSANGIITTLAGNGVASYSGDGGPASSAQLGSGGVAVDSAGNVYNSDFDANAVRVLKPTNQSVLISAVVDAASESVVPVSPGKIVVIYGGGLGPSQGATGVPSNGAFGTQLSGTTVTVNGVAAPVYYTSATQVNAIVPYEISGATAGIAVAYQGGVSSTFSAPIAASSPSFFTANSTGAGQAAAVNVVDGTLNTAANPVNIGAYISLYVTGEGQTTPAGVDGKLGTVPLPSPNLVVAATVGGIPATVQYKGGISGTVAGLMQVNVQIPVGVAPGGYVPVVLTVGNASTVNGAVWIAVSN